MAPLPYLRLRRIPVKALSKKKLYHRYYRKLYILSSYFKFRGVCQSGRSRVLIVVYDTIKKNVVYFLWQPKHILLRTKSFFYYVQICPSKTYKMLIFWFAEKFDIETVQTRFILCSLMETITWALWCPSRMDPTHSACQMVVTAMSHQIGHWKYRKLIALFCNWLVKYLSPGPGFEPTRPRHYFTANLSLKLVCKITKMLIDRWVRVFGIFPFTHQI